MPKTFDPKCRELAEHFMQDYPDYGHLADELAARIQEAIEDWFADREMEH